MTIDEAKKAEFVAYNMALVDELKAVFAKYNVHAWIAVWNGPTAGCGPETDSIAMGTMNGGCPQCGGQTLAQAIVHLPVA